MSDLFVSLVAEAPPGFTHRELARRDLLGARLALYAPSERAALAVLGEERERVRGLLLTPGGALAHRALSPYLWLLHFPPEMREHLRALGVAFLELMNAGERALDERGALQVDLLRARELLRHTRESYDRTTGLLGGKIQELRQEVVERKEAEERARRLRNYLVDLFNAMPSVLVGLDAQGRVSEWNAGATRATGLTAAAAVGLPLATALPQLAGDERRVLAAIASRQTLTDPKRARLVDGQLRYEDLTVVPLSAGGTEGAVVRLDEVTERVHIEELMVQSEKMLSIGGLAAGMAHEINNPLAGMMQSASVLRDRLLEDLPANASAAEQAGLTLPDLRAYAEARRLPELVQSILDSGRRAATIVSNMLGFARKSESTFSTHDLADLLDQSLDLARSDYDLRRKFDFRAVEIVRDYETNAPPVPCESSQIQQVLLNLLRNGAEAMHVAREEGATRPPRLTLRVRHEPEAARVRVEVEDNGPGMDDATRKRVFEPFFTTKPVERGTGLGLSVSYFIITENHGGEMSVRSRPGRGTCFSLCLPTNGRGGRPRPRGVAPAATGG